MDVEVAEASPATATTTSPRSSTTTTAENESNIINPSPVLRFTLGDISRHTYDIFKALTTHMTTLYESMNDEDEGNKPVVLDVMKRWTRAGMIEESHSGNYKKKVKALIYSSRIWLRNAYGRGGVRFNPQIAYEEFEADFKSHLLALHTHHHSKDESFDHVDMGLSTHLLEMDTSLPRWFLAWCNFLDCISLSMSERDTNLREYERADITGWDNPYMSMAFSQIRRASSFMDIVRGLNVAHFDSRLDRRLQPCGIIKLGIRYVPCRMVKYVRRFVGEFKDNDFIDGCKSLCPGLNHSSSETSHLDHHRGMHVNEGFNFRLYQKIWNIIYDPLPKMVHGLDDESEQIVSAYAIKVEKFLTEVESAIKIMKDDMTTPAEKERKRQVQTAIRSIMVEQEDKEEEEHIQSFTF